MDELEEIKQRKLSELQNKQVQNQIQHQQKMLAQIEALENIARQVLSKEAFARYCNIKSAHQELAIQILLVLAQLTKQTNIKELNDEQFKEILQQITPEKRETKITFK